MKYYIENTEYSKEEYEIKKAEVQAHVALIDSYVQKITDSVITLNDVPAEYYDEVYHIINAPQPEEIDPDQEFVDRLISEVNS